MRLIRGFASARRSRAFRLGRVEYVTRPEPDPEQQAALALALERLLARDVQPAAYRSLWRAEGIAENVSGEPRDRSVFLGRDAE
jgi:hypothetical protein